MTTPAWASGVTRTSENPDAPTQQPPPSAPDVAPPGELDARPWAYRTRTVAALDHRFAVRTTDPLLGEYLESLLSAYEPVDQPTTMYSIFECPELPGWYAVYVDDERLRFAPAPWLTLADVMWHINQSTVARSDRYVLLHASAAERDGVGVVLPAAMESGKTTLVAGLVRRGFRYITDEAAALEPATGLLHPFPKPLSIDEGSWEVLADLAPDLDPGLEPYLRAQWQVPVTGIRADAVAAPVAPRLIVTPRYVAGATTELVPLRRAEMVIVLARNTFHFRAAPRRNVTVLAEAARASDCFRLTVGDLGSACDLIERLVRDVTGGGAG